MTAAARAGVLGIRLRRRGMRHGRRASGRMGRGPGGSRRADRGVAENPRERDGAHARARLEGGGSTREGARGLRGGAGARGRVPASEAAGGGAHGTRGGGETPAPPFVELGLGGLAAGGVVLELVARVGAKLTSGLPEAAGADLLALTETLWRLGRWSRSLLGCGAAGPGASRTRRRATPTWPPRRRRPRLPSAWTCPRAATDPRGSAPGAASAGRGGRRAPRGAPAGGSRPRRKDTIGRGRRSGL